MTDEGLGQTAVAVSSKERSALVARALSEAARRARFSTKRRRTLSGGGLRARRGERLLRGLRIATFVLVVAIPSLVYGVYMGVFATPQYIAEARFTVRGGMPPSLDTIGNMTGAPSMMIIQDTQIILNYIESRSMVEALQRTVGFEKLYEKRDIDYFSRLKSGASVEKVLKYWKKHVDLKVQMPAGIVEFSVRAFSPADAVTIADAALLSSEQLVNNVNDQMRHDAVALAEAERQRAEASLAKARADLETARNNEGILDTQAASTALQGLLSEVQVNLIKMQQEFDSQNRYVTADAPQMKTLQSKIDAARQEVAKLRAQMTSPTPTRPPADIAVPAAAAQPAGADADKVLSGSMSRLDYATLENQIHEKIYAGALAALEHAKIASETKLMYINTFVKPVAPQDSKFPDRPLKITLVVIAALGVWGAIVCALELARNSLA